MGMVNEIFKPEIAGWDLRNAIKGLLNGLKKEQKSVPLTNFANITTIFKQKGSQLDMENDRGIFILPVFRMILEKRIYKDKYRFMDQNMSASNVGRRKNRNIRNHLFIVYGIINSVVQKNWAS